VNLEDHLAAETAYRNAILQQPDIRDWQMGLARTLNAQGRYQETVSLFDAYLARNAEDAAAWKLQANAYLGMDRPLEAAVNLESVRVLGEADTASLKLLGDIYMNAGIWDLAREAYAAVLEGDEDGSRFEAGLRSADLLYRSQAESEADKMAALVRSGYGQGLSEEDDLRLTTLEAKIARGLGEDAKAARLLESIVERDGTRGDAILELARYHRDQGNNQRAMLLLERAQNLDGFEFDALLERAQFMVADRRYVEASGLLRRALELKREPRLERFLARVEEAAGR
jgi:tetratricopeptide (TPR) repeat protein